MAKQAQNKDQQLARRDVLKTTGIAAAAAATGALASEASAATVTS